MAVPGSGQPDQKQPECGDGLGIPALQSVELTACWQARKRRSQMVFVVAVKGPFALEVNPLSKQRQRDSFAARPGRLRPWMPSAQRRLRLAEIIDHDIEYCYKGVHISHGELLPFGSVLC
ncbi:MAG: hypothetical protein J2P36_12220 [Ktedonobacteraceae bacterium]|nr:hypothetical protein [Ktedonobacteraceae bacterium]